MVSYADQSFGSGLSRRAVNSSNRLSPAVGDPLRPDVDPPPKPRPVFQLIAFGLIFFLACLQFLPATHFRDPSDPHRSWIPFDSDRPSASVSNLRDFDAERSSNIVTHAMEAERMHVFSWTDCLDLRAFAVLANSTLSSSRVSKHVYFHFILPEGEDEKLSYYKLKVLLPHSNVDIIRQKEFKEKLRDALPEGDLLWPSIHELTPLVIPTIYPYLSRFIYVAPDTIIKGKIEELFGLDLGVYAIAAAEDCSKRLGDYVNIDVLSAIQRTAEKSWVSDKPYDKNACTPDFNLLLLDSKRLDRNLIEAIGWWHKVLNLKDERSNQISPAIALAIYHRYSKLPSTWKLDARTNVLHYDGPIRVCSENRSQHRESNIGNIWRQYLSSKSDAILAH